MYIYYNGFTRLIGFPFRHIVAKWARVPKRQRQAFGGPDPFQCLISSTVDLEICDCQFQIVNYKSKVFYMAHLIYAE